MVISEYVCMFGWGGFVMRMNVQNGCCYFQMQIHVQVLRPRTYIITDSHTGEFEDSVETP